MEVWLCITEQLCVSWVFGVLFIISCVSFWKHGWIPEIQGSCFLWGGEICNCTCDGRWFLAACFPFTCLWFWPGSELLFAKSSSHQAKVLENFRTATFFLFFPYFFSSPATSRCLCAVLNEPSCSCLHLVVDSNTKASLQNSPEENKLYQRGDGDVLPSDRPGSLSLAWTSKVVVSTPCLADTQREFLLLRFTGEVAALGVSWLGQNRLCLRICGVLFSVSEHRRGKMSSFC